MRKLLLLLLLSTLSLATIPVKAKEGTLLPTINPLKLIEKIDVAGTIRIGKLELITGPKYTSEELALKLMGSAAYLRAFSERFESEKMDLQSLAGLFETLAHTDIGRVDEEMVKNWIGEATTYLKQIYLRRVENWYKGNFTPAEAGTEIFKSVMRLKMRGEILENVKRKVGNLIESKVEELKGEILELLETDKVGAIRKMALAFYGEVRTLARLGIGNEKEFKVFMTDVKKEVGKQLGRNRRYMGILKRTKAPSRTVTSVESTLKSLPQQCQEAIYSESERREFEANPGMREIIARRIAREIIVITQESWWERFMDSVRYMMEQIRAELIDVGGCLEEYQTVMDLLAQLEEKLETIGEWEEMSLEERCEAYKELEALIQEIQEAYEDYKACSQDREASVASLEHHLSQLCCVKKGKLPKECVEALKLLNRWGVKVKRTVIPTALGGDMIRVLVPNSMGSDQIKTLARDLKMLLEKLYPV